MLFIGDDWAEGHHDVVVQDDAGKTLARRRLPEGVDGLARFHELVASCRGEDAEPDAAQVVVVIETDRGPWVKALAAAGYRIYPANPKQAARHRETTRPARRNLRAARDQGRDASVMPSLNAAIGTPT